MEAYLQNIIYAAGLIFALAIFLSIFLDFMNSKKFKALLDGKWNLSSSVIYWALAISVSLIISVASIGILLLHLQSGIDSNGAPVYFEPNKFGDFFGGTLGPIFSFLSFFAVVVAGYLQKQQQDEILRLSQKSRDEESFYLLLDRFSATYDQDAARSGLQVAIDIFKNRSDLDDQEKAHRFACRISDSLTINSKVFARLICHIHESNLNEKENYYRTVKAFMPALQLAMCVFITKYNLLNQPNLASTFKEINFVDSVELVDSQFADFMRSLT